jgi:hypothetical protein
MMRIVMSSVDANAKIQAGIDAATVQARVDDHAGRMIQASVEHAGAVAGQAIAIASASRAGAGASASASAIATAVVGAVIDDVVVVVDVVVDVVDDVVVVAVVAIVVVVVVVAGDVNVCTVEAVKRGGAELAAPRLMWRARPPRGGA